MQDDRPPVVGIDHIVVEAGDEEALFDFLTGRLGLPVAWPVAQWGLVHEGGVALGSCNVGCNHPLDPSVDPAATVRAIAFAPAGPLSIALDELGRRGLAPTEPMASGPIDVSDDDAHRPWRDGWTNALLLGRPFDPVAFVCAYDHDVSARRADERARFDAGDGGPLGVRGLRAVVVHADDPQACAEMWAALGTIQLGGADPVVDLPEGPRLLFRHGSGPPALLLAIRSRDGAHAALEGLGLGAQLDPERGELRIETSGALGLDLRLVDA